MVILLWISYTAERIKPEENLQIDGVKMLLFAALFLCWTSQALSNECCKAQCSVRDKTFGPNKPLNIAVVGVAGEPGRRGFPGAPGTPCSETLVQNCTDSLMNIQSAFTKCGIYSTSWRRVVHINMTNPTAICPGGLHDVSNSATNQRACGWNGIGNCFRHTFPTGWTYTQVCGHVNGYQSGNTKAFLGGSNPSTRYADGVLITRGEGHKHLWTYAVGKSNEVGAGNYCMNGTAEGADPSYIPGFIGNDTFCESKHVNSTVDVAWEDTLWDEGNEAIQCDTPGDLSCLSPGWFLTQVSHTSDSIHVRWCTDEGGVYTDILEIWVQ